MSIFNLKNEYDIPKFKAYVNKLFQERAVVEVKKKLPNRTLAQNSYLHLLLGYFGSEYGCSFRCISCGQIKPYEQADCGHFHSRRHMATRFDEDNAHAECRACNRFSADHLIQYEKNLKAKIGQLRFDKLAWRASQAKKWTDFELIELTKYYKALGDKLSKEKGL